MRKILLVILATFVLAASTAPAADAAKPRTSQKSTARKKGTKAKAAPAKPRTSGDVRREQRRTAGEIEKTQRQINTNTRETRRQLNRLASLDAEINRNEVSIGEMQRRVAALESRIGLLSDSIAQTETQVADMRRAYGHSLRAMRSRRSRISPIAFVLGARSISEAWRRSRYLRELSEAHASKARRLRAAADTLAARRTRLAALHEEQKAELGRMAVARTMLREKQLKADTLVASLKREGASLKRALAEKRTLAAQLDRELDRIIAEEQRRAEEEARRKAAEEEARRKAAAEEAARKAKESPAPAPEEGGKQPAPKPAPDKSEKAPAMSSAAAERALSGSFQSNKGRLLFPVAGSYRVVGTFGRTDHPRIPGVQVQNSGIDIEAAGTNAYARAVFDGTVTSVFRIDGYQNIVILRHGEYLTVYAGLDRITVRKGDKVKAAQPLGHIFSDPDDGGRSVLHFELRHEKQKLNPSEWVKP